MILKDIQQKYPFMEWLEYVRNLLPTSVPIDENDMIVIMVPTYFEKLGDVLAKTSKRTISNYLTQRVVMYGGKYLTHEIRKRRLQYVTSLYGVQSEEPRWKECVYNTRSA